MTLPASARNLYEIVLHPQRHLFATGTEDGIVRLWDYDSKQLVRQFSGHRSRVWTLAFHPQGHWIASGGHDGTVKLWAVEADPCVTTLASLGDVMAIQFSPEGQWLAVSCDCRIQVWHTSTWQCRYTFTDHTDIVASLAFAPTAPYLLVSASRDETIRYWDLESGKCIQVLCPDRLYEGMTITGVKGLSEGQMIVLQ